MSDTDERVARLEVIAETNQGGIARMEGKIDNVSADIADIKLKMSKQNGYFSGAFSVILVVWTVTLAFAQHWWDKVVNTGEI